MFSLIEINLILLSIIGFLNVIIGAVTFFQGRESKSYAYFAGGAIAAGLWVLVGVLRFYMYSLAGEAISPYLLSKFTTGSAITIFFFFVLFASHFPKKKIVFLELLIYIGVYAAALISIFVPDFFIQSEMFNPTAIQPATEWGSGYYFVYIPAMFFLFTAGILKLFLQRNDTKVPLEKKQLALVLFGIGLAGVFGITFGLLVASIPALVDLFWIGRLSTLLFTVFTAYAILKTKLFDVKVIATELLTFSIWVFLLIRVLLSETLSDRTVNGALFVLVLIAGFFLIRSVIKEVEAREQLQILSDNLKIANRKLKEADEMKSQFLSIASHELRSPVTTVRNFTSMLLEGTFGKLPAAAVDGLQQVFDRATDMASMVESYLNVSRMEQGRMKYEFADVNLKEIVANTIEAYTSVAEEKGLSLKSSVPETPQKWIISGDSAKLGEVFNNLIDNSIKYTPKGSVSITLTLDGNTARFTLEDTGIGMSEETISKLFQLFSPGDGSRKVNPSSTGLGLYVVKRHVEAHKGKVWAESDGEGRGSRFIVEIPLKKVA